MVRGVKVCLQLGLLLTLHANAAEIDCDLGSRHQNLAQMALTEHDEATAIDHLESAVAACPTYAVFQQLGELLVGTGGHEQAIRASEMFVRAYDTAPTRELRAISVGRYAELLYHAGDPQRAMRYAMHALDLAPDIEWIKELHDAIEEFGQAEDIRRGFRDSTLKPLVMDLGTRASPRMAPR